MAKTSYSAIVTEKVGKRLWMLTQDYVTPYGTIPTGFIFNGASVPRILWWFADPAGELFEGACIHDYYYDNALETKAFADDAFYRTLLSYNVRPWKAFIAYHAVKLFGRGQYR